MCGVCRPFVASVAERRSRRRGLLIRRSQVRILAGALAAIPDHCWELRRLCERICEHAPPVGLGERAGERSACGEGAESDAWKRQVPMDERRERIAGRLEAPMLVAAVLVIPMLVRGRRRRAVGHRRGRPQLGTWLAFLQRSLRCSRSSPTRPGGFASTPWRWPSRSCRRPSCLPALRPRGSFGSCGSCGCCAWHRLPSGSSPSPASGALAARATAAADGAPAGQRPRRVHGDRVRAGHGRAVADGAHGDRLPGRDGVAAAARLAGGGCVGAPVPRAVAPAQRGGSDRLVAGDRRLQPDPLFAGALTGPSQVDRGRAGTSTT
jgi:hypothetical protein